MTIRSDDFLDKPREECGVFGVYAEGEDVARITYFALFSLQHRGQESSGIAVSDFNDIHLTKGLGLVEQVFDEISLEMLSGNIAIGHNRYSTTGSNEHRNASPIIQDSALGKFALAHNGNIVNTMELKKDLEDSFGFETTTDSEILAKLIAHDKGETFDKKIISAMKKVRGAYSITLLTKDALYVFRDPEGIRPLSIAKLNGGYAVASETCAFGTVGAKRLRDVEPGELIKISKEGMTSSRLEKKTKKSSFCIFEYIYFARPDSIILGKSVYTVRENLGKELAREFPVKADLVMRVPDSGIPAAIGYSVESGLPYREGLIKNRYIGRTFINPDQRLREIGIKLKLNALRSVITGKKIVLIDDSIVRGNTTKMIINLLREKGAREVHLRITCPPMKYPCFLGVDTATSKELIANNVSVEKIRKHINADSLGYLSLDNLVKATKLPKNDFCLACFNEDYPFKISGEKSKSILEKSESTIMGAGK